MLQDLGTALQCLLYECVGFLLSVLCVCVCGNYCDLNAGSAGETGCLLINEQSRWPWVGGSCERTASRSGGQHNTDTWAITNKTSQAADTSQRHEACVCTCLHIFVCVCMVLPVSQQTDVYSVILCNPLEGRSTNLFTCCACISCELLNQNLLRGNKSRGKIINS